MMMGAWAAITLPAFWTQIQVNKTGAKIAAGEPFKQAALTIFRPQLDNLERGSWSPPEPLHSSALIELRLAELESTGEKIDDGSQQIARTQRTIETTLRLIPTDSFMWFALFWLQKSRDGFNESELPYLRMSYELGPHEGWIAVRRSRTVVPLLRVLPKDLADMAVTELANLVASGYIEPVADIITGPGWGNHEVLLDGLANVPEEYRRLLANAIYDRGFDMIVPGIERHGLRPWK